MLYAQNEQYFFVISLVLLIHHSNVNEQRKQTTLVGCTARMMPVPADASMAIAQEDGASLGHSTDIPVGFLGLCRSIRTIPRLYITRKAGA